MTLNTAHTWLGFRKNVTVKRRVKPTISIADGHVSSRLHLTVTITRDPNVT